MKEVDRLKIANLASALLDLLRCFPEECVCHNYYRLIEQKLGYRFKDPDCSYCNNDQEIDAAKKALEHTEYWKEING